MFRALRARSCSRYFAPSGTRLRRSPRFDQACLHPSLLSTSGMALPLPPRVESRRRNKSRLFPSRKPRFASESLPSLGRHLTACQTIAEDHSERYDFPPFSAALPDGVCRLTFVLGNGGRMGSSRRTFFQDA